MDLTEKLASSTSSRETGIEMLNHLFVALNNDDVQAMITSFRADLENAAKFANGSFVFGRVKAPMSSSKKFESKEKYHTAWNRIKDLIAFTVVVDGNNDDVDKIRQKLVEKYEKLNMKNPNSSRIYEDYMRYSVRDDAVAKAAYIYQDPTGRNYQTNDGYKNVKLNLMLQNYPIEVQIKTTQQYIAHCATHDPLYKAPRYLFEGKTEEEQANQRNFVSDKMFPYFEAQAYLRLYSSKLSTTEIRTVREDIKRIYDRNFDIYSKYAPIFNEAKAEFGVYMYKLLHREDFAREKTCQKECYLMDFSTYEVKKVLKYELKQIMKDNDSLKLQTAISRAVDRLLVMPFDEFKERCTSLEGEYRLPGCVITGEFDGINKRFVDTLKKASDIFREIHVKVYGDEFSKAITGKEPIFSVDQRLYMISNCKYVTSVSEVQDFRSTPIESLSRNDEDVENKVGRYKIVSMTGVMDGCTPGHIKLMDFAQKLAGEDGEVYIGIKSDEYVQRVKHKTPINEEEERASVYNGLRGVENVYITDNDIKPNDEIVDKMRQAIENGERCAIITGSDWSKPETRASKPASSLEEVYWIEQNLKGVDIVPAPPRGEQNDFHTKDGLPMSSTVLKEALIQQKEDDFIMPIEVRELEENN